MQTSQTKKIVLIAIAILTILVGAYLYMRAPSSPSSTAGDVASERAEGETGEVIKEESTRGSFKDLLGRTTAQKCIVSQESALSRSSGTFYVAGGKGRGDFETTVLSGPGAGTVTKNSMIMDGEAVYVWETGMVQGMKISMTEFQTTSGATAPQAGTNAPQNTAAAQLGQTYDYDCADWRADTSLFVPPKNIEFTDMNEMMKSIKGMPATGGMPASADLSAMCASCDQAGEGRAACRAALNCAP